MFTALYYIALKAGSVVSCGRAIRSNSQPVASHAALNDAYINENKTHRLPLCNPQAAIGNGRPQAALWLTSGPGHKTGSESVMYLCVDVYM